MQAADATYRPRRQPNADEQEFPTPTSDAPLVRQPEGRGARQFRPWFMKANVVSAADGSAYIEAGRTKVMVAVHGPKDDGMGRGEASIATLSCDLRYGAAAAPEGREHKKRAEEEKRPSAAMLSALRPCVRLERYPKSTIEVYCTVLDDDGGALPAAITCAALALADAGIEMFDLAAACSLVRIGPDVLALDPSADEEALATAVYTRGGEDGLGAAASMTLASMPSLELVTHLVASGEMSVQGANDATRFLLDATSEVHAKMQLCLADSALAKMSNRPK